MKRILVVEYDVTDLTEAQTNALAGEAIVQAEHSDDTDPVEGQTNGHPEVKVRFWVDFRAAVPTRLPPVEWEPPGGLVRPPRYPGRRRRS